MVRWFAPIKQGIIDVGPRSAHIAGLDYAVFTPTEEIKGPKVVFFSPKEGDPADYVKVVMEGWPRSNDHKYLCSKCIGIGAKKSIFLMEMSLLPVKRYKL